MSYCRFSNDDYRCDVYVYDSVYDCYTVHVAANRVIYCEPLPPPVNDNDVAAWVARSMEVTDIVGRSTREKIGLSRDGKSFDFGTPGEAAEFLAELKSEGYIVPDYVIEALTEEQREWEA